MTTLNKPELTLINPLVKGLKGIDPYTSKPTDLKQFNKGYMDLPLALQAEKDKKVQIYIHESMNTLILEGSEKADDILKAEELAKAKPVRKKTVSRTKKVEEDSVDTNQE